MRCVGNLGRRRRRSIARVSNPRRCCHAAVLPPAEEPPSAIFVRWPVREPRAENIADRGPSLAGLHRRSERRRPGGRRRPEWDRAGMFASTSRSPDGGACRLMRLTDFDKPLVRNPASTSAGMAAARILGGLGPTSKMMGRKLRRQAFRCRTGEGAPVVSLHQAFDS